MNQPIKEFICSKMVNYTKKILKKHDTSKLHTEEFETHLTNINCMKEVLLDADLFKHLIVFLSNNGELV